MTEESYQFQRQDGVKLLQGTNLQSSGSGYTLKTPFLNHGAINELHEEFQRRYDPNNDFETAENLTSFISDIFDYGDISDGRDEVWLTDAIKNREGVCKEQAATYQVLAQREGLDSEFVRGTLPMNGDRYRHAWNKVSTEEGEMLADPTNNRFGSYDSVSDHNGYREGEQLLEVETDRDVSEVVAFLDG